MPKRLFIKDGGLTASNPTPAGFTVIGSENGVPKKQIISTISDIGGYTPPYKVYTALLTQTGVNAPVATILENTLGYVPTLGYLINGFYTITGVFDKTKTLIFSSARATNNTKSYVNHNSNTVIQILTLGPGDALADDILSASDYPFSIEIRVYD